MSAISYDSPVPHLQYMCLINNAGIARSGDKYFSNFAGLNQRHHLIAIHSSFQSGYRLHLGNDNLCTEPLSPLRYPFPTPAIARNDYFPRPEYIGGPGDAINCALPCSISVVKEMLGLSIVYGNNGVNQFTGPGHVPQSDDTGGCFLGATDDISGQFYVVPMKGGNQVRAIVHGNLRLMLQGGDDMFVVSLIILSFDGVDRNAIVHQGSSHIVLRTQRIGGA